jgi:hypothetical protein
MSVLVVMVVLIDSNVGMTALKRTVNLITLEEMMIGQTEGMIDKITDEMTEEKIGETTVLTEEERTGMEVGQVLLRLLSAMEVLLLVLAVGTGQLPELRLQEIDKKRSYVVQLQRLIQQIARKLKKRLLINKYV